MNKQLVVAMTSIAMIASSCVSTPKGELRKVASSSEVDAIAAQGKDYSFTNQERIRLFTKADIAKMASASGIKLRAGQILTGNDSAFDKKLELIEGAQKSVRMVYFIYASDDSSSKINKALIDKAKNGVPVTLLVDFVTNYKNLDLFSMLEREGGRNLKTYFYNVPTTQLLQDANYTVLPCPQSANPQSDTCFNSKKAAMVKMENQAVPTPFAKLLLAGMYGKNVTAMKVALGYGAQIDPKQYKSAKEHSEGIETEDMIQLAKLVSEAVIEDSLMAKIRLSVAMMTYGDTLNPMIDEITGRLPVRSLEQRPEHGKLWDHITDYTHHKLLAVDGSQFQMGGRNIEDSYHMNQRPADSKTGKYIFVDTDFWGQTKKEDGAKGIEDSFDKLMGTSMVASLQKVKDLTAYDFIANTGSATQPGAAEAATQGCVMNKAPDLGACILQTISTIKGVPGVLDYKSENERVDAKVNAMNAAIKNYEDEFIGKSLKKIGSDFGPMSAEDLATAEISYLENVNYQKGSMTRVMGSKIGSEADNGKNIQAAWYRGLESSCKVSREERDAQGNLVYSEKNPLRVIFHTAYLLMPSGMIHKLAKMMNNDYGDCSRVRITFITNSQFTTDLKPINMLARYQLGVLFSHYAGLVTYKSKFEDGGPQFKQFWPKIDYYELASGDTNNSLHTKTSLVGNDLIIGSANSDVRSYYMDTNNAILIRNAKEMNQQYVSFVDSLISSGRFENKINNFVGKSLKDFRDQNEYIIRKFAKDKGQTRRLVSSDGGDRVPAILNNLDKAGAMITNVTSRLILFRGDFDTVGTYNSGQGDQYKFNKELNDAANKFDSVFKVF